jgi:hypothetical protein
VAAELFALADQPDLVVQGGRARTVRTKKPCGGSIPPEKAAAEQVIPSVVLSEVSGRSSLAPEVAELKARQDKLATVVETALAHLGERMAKVEKTGTPFWVMTGSQKNVLIMSGATLLFLVIMGCLSVAFRVVGIPL